MARFVPAVDLARQLAKASERDRYKVAQQIAREAAAAAPRVTGAYAGGMQARRYGSGTVAVIDTDPDSVYKEYGTVDTPAHATLTNAARRHGVYRGR